MGTTITNPVINGPYDEPTRHFLFDDDGITDQIVDGRRRSQYFVPIPQTKKRGAQLQFDNEWTANRITPNEFVNDVRRRVDLWRRRGYQDVTPTTRRLLETVEEFKPDTTDDFAVQAEHRAGTIRVLLVRMNADLAMGESLLKTKAANLFTVFGEPDIAPRPAGSSRSVASTSTTP